MGTSPMLRRALVLVATIALIAGFDARPVGAASDSNHNPNNYLALGDSVPFGYNPLLALPGTNPNPDVFVGYPELASQLFRPRKKLFNASCPGETSTSLIRGTPPPDNSCAAYRQFVGQLHVVYTGTQLQYATGYLQANPRTGLVTMTIGANDLFLLVGSCAGSPTCVIAGLPKLLATLSTNLTTIYSALLGAGFRGELVAVTYYATDYRDAASVAVLSQVDATLAAVTRTFGGRVADGLEAFRAAAEPFGGDACAAGLLIRLPDRTCNIHPSPEGAALLADAVVHAT
jgi:hypothetical protein